MKRAAAFDRELDTKVNGAKAETLKQYGMPQYWLVISHIEAQALVAGVVSTEIRRQAETLLRPDMPVPDAVQELSRIGETGAWHPRTKNQEDEDGLTRGGTRGSSQSSSPPHRNSGDT